MPVAVSPVVMTAQQESSLWRQRLFESQAGMERYLTSAYGAGELRSWMPFRASLLPPTTEWPSDDDAEGWKSLFFRSQARLEEYLISTHGRHDLDLWATAIGQVFAAVEPGRCKDAAAIAHRFARQAHCYRSTFTLQQLDSAAARVQITHCAIWDYRVRAQRAGVHLPLATPCEFCTRATTANARSKEVQATVGLVESSSGHGCVWTFADANDENTSDAGV